MNSKLIFVASLVIFFSMNIKSQEGNMAILKANLLLDSKSALGEGAFWAAHEKVLYWIDIEGGLLNSYNPADATNEIFEMGKKIGTVVPVNDSKVIVALEDGAYTYDVNGGELTLLCQPFQGQTGVRFNDGKCDPEGRLWVGTMANDCKSNIAALYKIDGSGKYLKMIENVIISNGIVWTSDKKSMYYIDTPTKKIVQYDYDNASGNISNKKVIIEVPDSIGSPDGMAIDKNNNIWVAMWGGASVRGYNPKTGKMIATIEVPAPNVTSIAFGGDNLDILFITTAQIGLNEESLRKYPLSGSMFSVKPGVVGVPSAYFKLK